MNVSSAGEVKSDDELDVESENSAEEMNSPGATGGVFVHTAAVEENDFFFNDRYSVGVHVKLYASDVCCLHFSFVVKRITLSEKWVNWSLNCERK